MTNLRVPFMMGNNTSLVLRICPGRNLALKTLYLVISCVLSVFKIGPTTDDNGNPQVPEAEFRSYMIR